MQHRVGLRARTDIRVIAKSGGFTSHWRGIEISASGIVVDGGREPAQLPLLMRLELRLPERIRPLRALARPIWARGTQQALKFVRMSDVDRLTLAEHLDVLSLSGVNLS
jgi:hypothetical protein